MCLEMEGFKHSSVFIPSTATFREKGTVNKLFISVNILGTWCLPTEHIFLFPLHASADSRYLRRRDCWTFFRTQQVFSKEIIKLIFPKDCKRLSLQWGQKRVRSWYRPSKCVHNIVFDFSASGMMCPPMLNCPYKWILSEIIQRVLTNEAWP